MLALDPETHALLRLTLTPGLGPVLIARLIEAAVAEGEAAAPAQAAVRQSESGLKRIKGIGQGKAPAIAAGLYASAALAEEELRLASTLGVRIISWNAPDYPTLLRPIPCAPPILYVRGTIEPTGADAYPIAIVGSRSCSAYGIEQAERFAGMLAERGLTVISGGARGIDTAAHLGALRLRGRTIAVLGCGLAHCYPPDNAALFETLAGTPGAPGAGALISELPLNTQPSPENFPARNRIISGCALGVLVVEAGRQSGALITARVAVEEQGREVFALPGRIDSSAIAGSLDLIKSGGAAMVTHPDDILAALESAARHAHAGTHDARFSPRRAIADAPPSSPDQTPHPSEDPAAALFAPAPAVRRGSTRARSRPAPGEAHRPAPATTGVRDVGLTDQQRRILAALEEPRTLDQLSAAVEVSPGTLRAEVTILELHRRVARRGSLLVRQ